MQLADGDQMVRRPQDLPLAVRIPSLARNRQPLTQPSRRAAARERPVMHPFAYEKVANEHEALERARLGHATFVAGGTTLIDLMKLNVEILVTGHFCNNK